MRRSDFWACGGRIALAVGATLSCACALAQDAPCKFEDGGSGTVASVGDARTIVMQDGREVRLAGIEVPAPRQESGQASPAAAAAKAALEALVASRAVALKHLAAKTDRHGRLV